MHWLVAVVPSSFRDADTSSIEYWHYCSCGEREIEYEVMLRHIHNAPWRVRPETSTWAPL